MEWTWKQSPSSHIRTPAQITTLAAPLMRLRSVSQYLSSLSEPASSLQAEQRRIVLQVARCVSLSHQLPPPWLDTVSPSLLFLPDWVKSLPGYSRVSWKSYRCCSRAFVLDHLSQHITFQSSIRNSHAANTLFPTKTSECTHTAHSALYPLTLLSLLYTSMSLKHCPVSHSSAFSSHILFAVSRVLLP